MDPILTHKAKGAAWEFWQALLAGDGCAILCLLGDPENGIGPNSVFDTSDLDEWKKYRTNFRWLSACSGQWGVDSGGGWGGADGLSACQGWDLEGGTDGGLFPIQPLSTCRVSLLQPSFLFQGFGR